MICIRIFQTFQDAKKAKEILTHIGISATVNEDRFGTKTLSQYGFPSRFRLFIRRDDFEKAVTFMESELKKTRLY